MKPDSYVYSPNNVFGVPGREIYPSCEGIPALPNVFRVYDVGEHIDVYVTTYGSPTTLAHVLRFYSADDYISHCESIGYKSKPALPAYYNSDI